MRTFEPLAYGMARRDMPELIDQPGVEEAELSGNLRDLSLINTAFGGAWLTCWGVAQFVQKVQFRRSKPTLACEQDTALNVLDIGSGMGDIPQAVAQWAARNNMPLRITATDISPVIVQIAANAANKQGHSLAFAAADGLHLPFSAESVDIAMCSLALHHFDPQAAVAMLREMRRVARHGLVVNDIVRSWVGLGGAWLVGHALSQNRLTRHDGLVSVWRAYTPAELRELAGQAGLRVVAMRGVLGYRVAMVLV